jgi:hypothetical protein
MAYALSQARAAAKFRALRARGTSSSLGAKVGTGTSAWTSRPLILIAFRKSQAEITLVKTYYFKDATKLSCPRSSGDPIDPNDPRPYPLYPPYHPDPIRLSPPTSLFSLRTAHGIQYYRPPSALVCSDFAHVDLGRVGERGRSETVQ